MIASVSYTANGAQDTFSVTFPYLTKADVDVYLNTVLTTLYTWLSDTQIKLDSMPAANTEVTLTRSTQAAPYVDFTDPGFLVEGDLDTAFRQALYIAQEAVDFTDVSLQLDVSHTFWDALNKQIRNLAEPSLPTDAVTRNYADRITTGAGNLPSIQNPADDNKWLRALAGVAAWTTLVVAAANISDSTAAGRALLTAATAAAQRIALGSTTVGDALFIAVDAAAGRSAITAAKQYTPQTLTASNSVTIDASTGDYFKLTANTSFTLENPTNPSNGQRILLRILQDATGGRVLTFGTKFRLGADISAVVLSTVANKTDYLGFVYDSTADKWDVIAFVKGY